MPAAVVKRADPPLLRIRSVGVALHQKALFGWAFQGAEIGTQALPVLPAIVRRRIDGGDLCIYIGNRESNND